MKKALLTLFLAVMLTCFVFLAGAHAATISGVVFNDGNLNGNIDEEKGIYDIDLSLQNANGEIASTTTSRTGEYIFEGIEPGEYRIFATLPKHYTATTPVGENALLPASGEDVQTRYFTLLDQATVNLGVTTKGVNFIFFTFEDLNANGGRMSNEPKIKDVEVSLTMMVDGEEYVATTAKTPKSGELRLYDCTPGQYRVKVTVPSNYLIGPLGAKINAFYNCINPSTTQVAYSDTLDCFDATAMGIGMVQTGDAKGSLWLDDNANGLKDESETSFIQPEITLTGNTMNVIYSPIVNEDGTYSFAFVQPGEYTLNVSLPQGYMFTLPGGDSVLTQSYASTQSIPLTIEKGKTTPITPIGLMPATNVTVQYFMDANRNGTMDEEEIPYANALLQVIENGQVVASATSDANGIAHLPVVVGGFIELVATLEKDNVFSPSNEDSLFSTSIAQNVLQVQTSITHATNTTYTIPVTQSSCLEGSIFADSNNNGLLENGEKHLENFTVQALNENMDVVAECVSDANGHYAFDALLPVPHSLRILLPSPWVTPIYKGEPNENASSIKTYETQYGQTDVFALSPKMTISNVNIGVFQAGTVSGHAKLPDETGFSNLSVQLMDEAGVALPSIPSVLTDADGYYHIKGVLPGTYSLCYTVPAEGIFANTDDASIYSEPFTVSMGTVLNLPNIKVLKASCISGTCQTDGVEIAVTLTETQTNQKTTTTIKNGEYALEKLREGTYELSLQLPEGYGFGYNSTLVSPSTKNTAVTSFTLAQGEILTEKDLEINALLSLNASLYYDIDNSRNHSSADCFADIACDLLAKDGTLITSLTSDENGVLPLLQLLPGEYILSFPLNHVLLIHENAVQVENGWQLPLTLNESLVKEGLEVGVLVYATLKGNAWSLDHVNSALSGITIHLLSATDNQQIATTTTNEKGAYSFTHLVPGSYKIAPELPEASLFPRTVDIVEKNSVILADSENGKLGHSESIVILMGGTIEHFDFGFGEIGSIGDFVWLDENKNGMHDIGEVGLPEIQISMYQYGQLVASTKTNPFGYYSFDALYPGTYTMKLTASPELTTTLYNADFPLVNSEALTASDVPNEYIANDIMVKSGVSTLSYDFAFALLQEGVYPSSISLVPQYDWTYGGNSNTK